VESVPAWDSLAAVTLIAVLEQEFDTQIDLMELPELTSYQAVRDYLQRQIK
jgi:acyl carrier protein